MNQELVIFHGGCRDGFCAAWVHSKYNRTILDSPKAKYHAGYYGQAPPDVIDKDVVILDFCYPLEIMVEIVKTCKTLTWIDHHKTAEPFVKWLENSKEDLDNVQYSFDNKRSGAGLTWDYYFKPSERPWLVNYTEDRDLWKKALIETDKVNAYISVLEFDFDVWDDTDALEIDDVIVYGEVAEDKTNQYVREVCKNVYFADINASGVRDVEGKLAIFSNKVYERIPVVNICQIDCSEVLETLAELYPDSSFSFYWFKRADGLYQYGMRSKGDFDVSEVAKIFGGGGHRNAAGFQLPYLLNELK